MPQSSGMLSLRRHVPASRPAFQGLESLEGRVLMSTAPGGTRAAADVPWALSPVAYGAIQVDFSTPVATPAPAADPTSTDTPEPLPESGLTAVPAATVVSLAAKVTPLGGNLNEESDRIPSHAFTDLIRTTLGFYNQAGRKASNGKPDFAKADANGWPLEDFAVAVANNAEFGGEFVTPGVYHMSFTGPSTTTVAIRRGAPGGGTQPSSTSPLPTIKKIGYDAATKTATYDVTVPANVVTLAFDFRNTGGQVKNLKVLQPGYNLASYPTFTNEYLNLLRNLKPNVIRFMDWTHTNGNLTVNWNDRPKTTDATIAKAPVAGDLHPAKGIPWVYVAQLANTLHTNLWVNVPAHASDDYVKQLATYLKSAVASDLNIYIEYSNEVWNTGFEQASYNRNAAGAEVVAAKKAGKQSNLNYDNLAVDTSKADGGGNVFTWADRRYARRLIEIGNIFKGVFGATSINTRIRPVLASQVANLGRFDNMLKFVNTVFGAPKNYFYGIGVAPYVNLGSKQNTANLTKDQVLAALSASVTSLANGTALSTAKSKASAYGLKLEAYEGGIDTFGDQSVAAKKAASLDPQIQSIVTKYLQTWYAKGGDQFNWFTLGARSFNSPYGTYSITDKITNLNEPKEIAFRSIRDAGLGG